MTNTAYNTNDTSNDYLFDAMGRYRRERFTTTPVTHYDMTGNTYHRVASNGFCGATTGGFTVARDEVTCTDCLTRIA